MKKLSLILLILFSLTSCFGGNEDASSDKSEEDGLSTYDSSNFSVRIPTNWEEISADEVATPNSGNLELAYRSSSEDRSFLNNIIIVSESLEEEVSSSTYTKKNVYLPSRQLSNLRDIQSKNIGFQDDDSSRLYVFEAQYQPQFGTNLFFQTAKVCNKTAFTLTIGLDVSTDPSLYQNYETILQSFTCK